MHVNNIRYINMPDNKKVTYKKVEKVINGEVFRTDTSMLLAYDQDEKKYLFRALSSDYFLQDDSNDEVTLLDAADAQKLWVSMPGKYITNIVAAFPQFHGGIGIDTYTNLYDD